MDPFLPDDDRDVNELVELFRRWPCATSAATSESRLRLSAGLTASITNGVSDLFVVASLSVNPGGARAGDGSAWDDSLLGSDVCDVRREPIAGGGG